MEVKNGIYAYHMPFDEKYCSHQSASSASSDTYKSRAIRKSDKPTLLSKRVLGIEFLMCNSCFWCASYYHFSSSYNRLAKCPACNSFRLESMPLFS